MALAVHLEGACRAQDGRPLNVVGRRPHVSHGGQQEKVLHVEDAGGLVGALQLTAEPAEVPRFVVGHGGVGHAGKLMARHLHGRKQLMRLPQAAGVRRGIDQQIKFVELFPHCRGDDLANRARVLPGGADAGPDRIDVVRIEREKLDDALLRGRPVALLEFGGVAGNVHEGLPLLRRANRQIEHEIQVDVDETRDVLGALDVAAHPVDGIGDTTEHYRGTPRGTSTATSPPEGPSSSAGSSASTQVSLLPPPCDELTTNDPFVSATRVKPPGKTKISSPCRMYGRRSTWRPSNWPPMMVGTRESDSTGCAMYLRGCASIRLAKSSCSAFV